MLDCITTYTCKKCGIEKPLTEEFFPPRKDSKTGFRSDCRDCNRNRSKAWRAENPERLREYMEQWRAENPEYNKRYYAANAEQLRGNDRRRRAEHPEKQREKAKRWQQNNPDKVKAASHRRRARKRDLFATFTVTDWQKALAYFNGGCAYCGRPVGLWHKLAQDHFIALVNGGSYTPDNIVPACHGDGGCNNSKHDRDPQEWLVDRFGKRRAKAILQRIETYFRWVREQEG